ncbi:hypothetical protein Hs30E_15780 [Lactococcus hodotermopsidis]|uniref:Uncharacterized protein n=1 Tax=Pseudolactococcus hodotermopsidis TaxID=2709157 RepID=A0A6A0BGW5_9LACT|nr:hypothetical protein [Lactococcus hodotermopsidis]GFH43027.1 hypothetical protein Hs30E_15780 [Lactococcus hodotermopsidis]
MQIRIINSKIQYAKGEYTMTKYGVSNFLRQLNQNGVTKLDDESRENLKRLSRLAERGRLV